MSKVIILSTPCFGHINVTIGLVKELLERGEEVIYYSNEEYRKVIEHTGVVFRSYDGRFTESKELIKDNQIWQDRLNEIIGRLSYSIEENDMRYNNIFEEVKAENPDYIIYDTFCMCGKRIANELSIPSIASIPIFVYNDDIAKIDPDNFVKNVLLLGDESVFKTDKSISSAKLLRVISRIISKKFGLKNFNVMDAYNCYTDLNIVFTSELFQPHAEVLNDSFKFVGCSIGERDQTVEFPIDKLDGRPLIYISLGTTYVNERLDFFQKCINAFKDCDMQIILSKGNKITLEMLGQIPQNFIVKDYVPQLEVLKKASIFITHGGANSSNEAFYYNVPVVLYPQSGDQFDVAHRVEELGAGREINASKMSVIELREEVESVLKDKFILENCKIIGDSLRNAGGCRKAVDEIFNYKRNKGVR